MDHAVVHRKDQGRLALGALVGAGHEPSGESGTARALGCVSKTFTPDEASSPLQPCGLGRAAKK